MHYQFYIISPADGYYCTKTTRPEMYELSEPFLDITLPGKDSPELAYWDPKSPRIKYHCFHKFSNSKVKLFDTHRIMVLLFCSSLTALSLTNNKNHRRLAIQKQRKLCAFRYSEWNTCMFYVGTSILLAFVKPGTTETFGKYFLYRQCTLSQKRISVVPTQELYFIL